MQKQLNEHMKNKLSPFLCGYKKGFSTQYALLSLIECWNVSYWWSSFDGFIESV